MRKNVKDIDINYIQYGNGTQDIVLLHGWGQNIAMMRPLGDLFQDKYKITILDLPGFGESKEPVEPWSIDDYVDCLNLFLKELKVKKPILMGHSFGGRVAIAYSANYKVHKLCLFGSPCMRNRELTTKEKTLKALKKIPFLNNLAEVAKNYIGSRDYKAASPIMRQTLVNVINQDLTDCAKNIMVPTLLIWGELDTEAPVDEARELEKIIPDAGLVVLAGLGHYAYLDNLPQVYKILLAFLKED